MRNLLEYVRKKERNDKKQFRVCKKKTREK